MNSAGDARVPRSAGPALAYLQLASVAVLAFCLLAAFRIDFGRDLALLAAANGARLLLAAGAGAALCFAGAVRVGQGRTRPLAELELFGLSAGAAAGGWLAVQWIPSLPDLAAFAMGALLGAATGCGLARALHTRSRWSNLGVGLILGAFIAAAALIGTYTRERGDMIATAVAWLLGDLSGAGAVGSSLVLVVAIALVVLGARAVAAGEAGRNRADTLAWLGLGLGVGAAGPLVLVGSFVPRTIRALAPGSSPGAVAATSGLAGAASVAAIDAVPRLLVGGYALPFNVAAGMLLVPFLLGWNHARLRGDVGKLHPVLEALEVVGILAATAIAIGLATFLTLIVRNAT